MGDVNYKAAYERQKKSREIAEQNLENKSRELYEANQSLSQAYNRLKDQKSQILQQEKLASIGQLAAGVAHEINNPTGFVKSNINSLSSYIQNIQRALSSYESLISQQVPDGEGLVSDIQQTCDLTFILQDMESLIDESLDGVKRVEDIVTSLKLFARPDQDKGQAFSINECINNTIKLLIGELKHKAELTTNLHEVPPIMGQSGAMSQVILNLIVNAADAIEENGLIEISTTQHEKDIKIRIADNGKGIPNKVLTHIFDPFYSSKEVGKGTGLGLSISHSIVKKHGGRISVSSEENKGTEFTIYLPAYHP